MNTILDAPVATERKLEYAGFWIRFVAIFIDGVVIGIVQWVLAFAILGASFSMTDPDMMGYGFGGLYFFGLVLRGAYFTVMESSARQGTLGKMAVGIKVGDEQGQRLTFANALGRWACKFLSGIILLIGYIMAGFDDRKQALHDKIAKTTVYYG